MRWVGVRGARARRKPRIFRGRPNQPHNNNQGYNYSSNNIYIETLFDFLGAKEKRVTEEGVGEAVALGEAREDLVHEEQLVHPDLSVTAHLESLWSLSRVLFCV